MKHTAKADSVGLYVKQIGHKILPSLLPGISISGLVSRPKTSGTVTTKVRIPHAATITALSGNVKELPIKAITKESRGGSKLL